MEKKQSTVWDTIWDFFASVKLALFVLFALAITSIIGTIVPQKEQAVVYIQKYGPAMARIFELLDIPDMYNSWWFVALLSLFSLNLTICSLERLPNVWRFITADNLRTEPERLAKMALRRRFTSALSPTEAAAEVEAVMGAAGWKAQRAEAEGGIVLFSGKGAWTRLGVYIVHISMLVIFVGAIIGSVWGYKAFVMLPERSYTDQVYAQGTNQAIKLPFQLVCERFDLTYYPNGAPKEYRSQLKVFDNGQEVLAKSIVVNDPLQYRGITMYQASYQGYEEFLVTLADKNSGESETLRLRPGQKQQWNKAGLTVGIVKVAGTQSLSSYQLRLWIDDEQGEPSVFWLDSTQTASVARPAATYQVSSKQYFATGLQVVKDPGVWTVYIGCTLMLLGLLVAFFLSHRRLWVYIDSDNGTTRVLLAGVANKNKAGFENNFEALAESLQENSKLQLGKE